jgi:hypothetical protein
MNNGMNSAQIKRTDLFNVSHCNNSEKEVAQCSLPNGIEITANNSQIITKLYI